MAEVEIGGATIKGGKLMLVIPIVSALGGGLWGGFEFYKDYMDIEARNNIIETKLESAIDYTRDIKDDLREDIMKMEGYIDKIDSKVEKSVDSVKDTKTLIDASLENMLSSMNQLQKDTTSSLREVESLNRETEKDVRNTMRETEDRIDSSMRQLEEKLTKRLQEALDNPLSD
jgi:methyl-accepting chemotaxis protein